MSKQSPRTRVKRASERYAAARLARDTAIVDARAAGMSLREIADVSDLAVESVRRVLKAKGVIS